ncbi:MAG: oxidoreductase [Actinomycetia bacterium]|nr:oxidoreductase [Actinomycetes bacterium]
MIPDRSNVIADRNAVITGSGAGVGRALAIQMARAGAHVWVNDLNRDRAESVCAEIEAEGLLASPVIADVCDGDAVGAMVRETGPVDILVNNAGIPESGVRLQHFAESEPEDWEPLIRLNLFAVLGVTRAYLPGMIENGWGRILTIVSDSGRKGERHQAVYGAAKAAAMGFSRGLAHDVGRQGITVNCIALGAMNHGVLADAIEADPGLERKLSRPYPAGRLGRPEDVAPLAVLLCSDGGAFITGQVYPVDGGYFPAL